MSYNFDEIIDRRGTDSIKIERMQDNWGRKDLIPMWLADMDFRTPPFIMDAIRKRCEHEILGYTCPAPTYAESIVKWQKERHGLEITPDMIQFSPGIVPGLAFAIQCFTKPGDKVIIQTPVYYPFFITTEKNGRIPAYNPLVLENGQYRMDIEHLKKIIDKDCKLLLLCNPHNPGGRIWSKEELEVLAGICHENNIIIVSDEIHADLALPGQKHTTFAAVSEKARCNSVSFMAASKAFNIPGLSSSYAVIPNKELKERFSTFVENSELGNGHVFAFIAVSAAYRNGSEWLCEVTRYIQSNIDYLDAFLKEQTPKIKAIRPQASYLVFLDCRELCLPQEELVRFFVEGARLALNDGAMFGKEGKGFMRMNIGCPRATLQKALNNLKIAYLERFA